MSDIPTNEDLIALQRQITEALQRQVLATLGVPEYRSHLEALGYSVRLLDRLTTNDFEKEMRIRQYAEPIHIREY